MSERTYTSELEDTQQSRYLAFTVGSETYGIEIGNVKEIIGLQPITPLPEAPGHVKGIINLRGRIIPVVSSRLRFGMPEADYTDRTCIVVIQSAGADVGLVVDSVSEVLPINEENIVPPPALQPSGKAAVVRGIGMVGNDVKLLLDCQTLFCDEERSIYEKEINL